MVRDDTNDSINRRRFLQLAGASVISTGVVAGTGNAQPTSSDEPPYHVSGHRTHRYVPDGNVYQHHEKFVSDELKDPYGTPVVTFEVDQVARELIPEKYKNTDVSFTVEWDGTAVIGTVDEFAADERNSVRSEAVASPSALPAYLGRQYAYKNGSKIERASPINVGWYQYYGWTADAVKNTMENDFGWPANWNSPIAGYSWTRYIIGGNGGLEGEDAEVAKIPTGAQPFAQWHIRLWNVSKDYSNGYPVIGQAHYDIRDHGIITDPSFQFATSRNRVLSAWKDQTGFSTTNQKIYNGSGFPDDDSSEGKIGLIH
jgi:hypothetical protein